ncbi:MAG: hotdog domain-containing protein [Rhizomicrobium sp.]
MDIGKRILANQPFPTLMGVEIVGGGTRQGRRPAWRQARSVHRRPYHAWRRDHGLRRCAGRHRGGAQHAARRQYHDHREQDQLHRRAKEGTTVTGESTPVHVGKRTSVWTTRIAREDGKLVAIVTQTQMILLP